MSAFVVVTCEADIPGGCDNWTRGADGADVDAARAEAAAARWTRTPDGGDLCPVCSTPRPRVILDFPDRPSR